MEKNGVPCPKYRVNPQKMIVMSPRAYNPKVGLNTRLETIRNNLKITQYFLSEICTTTISQLNFSKI